MTGGVDVVAFTDGAAKGNPGPGGWGTVLWIGGQTVCELGGAGGRTTNNRMELVAALSALEWIAGSEGGAASLTIATDSTYLLKGVTEWIASWKRRGWKTLDKQDVANRDLWERIDALASAGPRPKFRYVPGHAGFPGNERADEIASEFALGHQPKLYVGTYEGYGFDLARLPDPNAPMRSASKTKTGGAKSAKKAHSYVSVVDGVVATHASWSECERRVKGRSNARFKKTASAAEERALVAEWGGRD
jgi:ribonuclease HI